MVITIEPGLYKENHLGIRIEDDVLITNNSCESLTTFSRELKNNLVNYFDENK